MLTLTIIFFSVSLYLHIINNKIVVDDIRWLSAVKSEDFRKNKSLITRIRFQLYGIGTLWTKKLSDELNLKIDHALTIVLHTIASCLIYFAFGVNEVSFAAAILYCCNPINTQTSIWSNGRRYLINVILVLLMVIYKPLFILYPATFLFHFTAALAPLMLGLVGIPLILAGLLFSYKPLKQKAKIRIDHIHSPDLKTYTLKRIIPMVKIYGFYFTKMIFPGTVKMMYPNLYFWGVTEEGNKDAYAINVDFLMGLFCLALSIVGLVYFKDIMFLFLVLSIAQWCPMAFSIVQGLADRYVSVASVFMMYFLAKAIYLFSGSSAGPIVACLVVYYVSMLTQAFKMYKNINLFYDYHVFHNYEHPGIRALKGNWHILSNEPMEAWSIIKTGLKFSPNDFRLNLAAAECCYMFRDPVGVKNFVEVCEKNYYIGQKEAVASRMKVLKDRSGITAFENEVELIKQGKSTLPAVERKRVLAAAGIKDE